MFRGLNHKAHGSQWPNGKLDMELSAPGQESGYNGIPISHEEPLLMFHSSAKKKIKGDFSLSH